VDNLVEDSSNFLRKDFGQVTEVSELLKTQAFSTCRITVFPQEDKENQSAVDKLSAHIFPTGYPHASSICGKILST
tara:strand:+ start:135 stop:362 length:228 start_codon:yes stop_codon:yes gene_type:complete